MANDSPTYAPMLAGTSQDVPAGDAWRFEIKWDGFRAIARVNGNDVRLWSRNGKALEGAEPVRRRGPARTRSRAPTACSTASCARSTRPACRASSCSSAARARSPTSCSTCSSSTASPSSREPWSRRRELLTELIVPGAPVVVLSQVYDDGEALLAAARRRGLEGIMAKRVKSPYRPGRRSDDWRKIKLRRRRRC